MCTITREDLRLPVNFGESRSFFIDLVFFCEYTLQRRQKKGKPLMIILFSATSNEIIYIQYFEIIAWSFVL